MLGLTMRERLLKAVYQVCVRNSDIYKFEIYKLLEKYGTTKPPEDEIEKASRKYFDSVRKDIFDVLSEGSPNLSVRLNLAFKCPALCGYPDIKDGLYMAGAVYVICFWAIEDKVADPTDGMALNRLQQQIMDDVLTSLDNPSYTTHEVKGNGLSQKAKAIIILCVPAVLIIVIAAVASNSRKEKEAANSTQPVVGQTVYWNRQKYHSRPDCPMIYREAPILEKEYTQNVDDSDLCSWCWEHQNDD